jgi:hypothetical protein
LAQHRYSPSRNLPGQKTLIPYDVTILTAATRLLRSNFPTKNLICSHLFTEPPRGIVAKKSGSVPYQKATDFFFTKRSNPIKIRATYDTGVPTQASNSFEFLAEAESVWELHSAIFGGAGEQWTRRELFIF